MTPALKILTWHLPELIGPIFSAIPLPDVNKRVAQAILDLPAREQPDVIAFNGVADRKVLLEQLSPIYPNNTISPGGTPGSFPDDDSGLLLLSKLPLLPLPTGGSTFYEPFKDARVPDLRGVGVVRVAGPYNPTTIAFTHTYKFNPDADQAFSVAADPTAIREIEFAFIRAVLLKVANGNLQNYANSAIVGDLNVDGETSETLSELGKVFAGIPGTFGGDFADGWGSAMHAPGDLTGHDPGYTQRVTPQLPHRLDYQCTRRDANVDIGLVPHHMSTPLRLTTDSDGFSGPNTRPQYTDRWGLMARLHRIGPHCSPSTAVELLKIPPVDPTTSGSKLWILSTDFPDQDMYHWVYIDSGGTYSVFRNKALEVAAFRRSDLTHELAPVDTLSSSTLPPAVTAPLQGPLTVIVHRFEDQGSVFAWREPFFLRFRGAAPTFSGQAPFAIVEHHGESAKTAFVLQPHLLLNPGLPAGQKLGTRDECFFRADRPERFSKGDYEDRFTIANPAGAGVTVRLCDALLAPLQPEEKTSAPAVELHRKGPAETVFLILTRDDVNDVDFSVTWDSGLCYLTLESISLEVNEETGPDWPGSDTLDLSVSIDGENVYSNTWDDADSDEDWPNLAEDIRVTVRAKVGAPVDWVAVGDEILFTVAKTDGAFAHGSEAGTLAALKAEDADVVTATGKIDIIDPAGDGEILFGVELRKFPPY
jgi:hypothetical protein